MLSIESVIKLLIMIMIMMIIVDFNYRLKQRYNGEEKADNLRRGRK